MSYYPPLKFFTLYVENFFVAIAHNTEQCGLVLNYSLENRILPQGVIYPQFRNHWFR